MKNTQDNNAEAVRSGAWLGVDQIRAERERQISGEGWGSEHDDEHTEGEMIAASIAYAVAAHDQVIGEALPDGPPATWPWEAGWWKRDADPIRNLVKAGALIAAEIDRLDRERRKTPNDKLTDSRP